MSAPLLDHIDPLTETSINNPIIRQLFSALVVKAKLSEKEHKDSSIKLALERRCVDFREDQSHMIDTIINRQ